MYFVLLMYCVAHGMYHTTPYHQCKANIFGTTTEAKVSVDQLSFLEDGASLHLVMNGRFAMMSDFDAGGKASGAVCVGLVLRC